VANLLYLLLYFFFQAEGGIRVFHVTGVQTCALPIWPSPIAANEVIVTPSTSLSGRIASNTAGSSTWSGTGCWTRIPSTVSSADKIGRASCRERVEPRERAAT